MADRIFFIDGHALIFKMYYAFLRRPMINSKGVDTSILFGFTKYILELIEKEKPTHLAVAFDPPGGTFRNTIFKEYKANRPPTPQLIIDALEPLTELCHAMNIPTLMIKGFEADDVIGTMAKNCEKVGMDVYMVTPDKDYGQLISEHIHQFKPGKGGSDNEIVGVEEVCKKYGINNPLQVIEMLTICGDTADNVPGVKGVGEVGAGKLISKYGSVEAIYQHLNELSAKQQEMFAAAKDHIELSHDLVTIKTDVEISYDIDQMKLSTGFKAEIADLFEKYEFGSLKKFLNKQGVAVAEKSVKVENVKKEIVKKKSSLKDVSAAAKKSGRMSVIVKTWDKEIFSIPQMVIVAAMKGDTHVFCDGSPADFKEILEDASIEKCGEDLKLQISILKFVGIDVKGKLLDIGLMHYLTEPEKSHSIEVLAKSFLDISIVEEKKDESQHTGTLFDDISTEEPTTDRNLKAAVMLDLCSILLNKLKEANALELYTTMEEPLMRVLSKMEMNGVKVDLDAIKEFAQMLRTEMKSLEDSIKEASGEPELNVSSPKQIGELLFEKLKLSEKPKKNDNGTYSTDEATLLEIESANPIVTSILDYRATKKLLSTYIEPFPSLINKKDGKVHTTYNQALTSTGRLSSSNPNLQNIPIRTERGKEIRKAFVPSTPDGVILSADYSQIELRIMAHLSCDQHLIKAFKDGIDVHAATAAKIFGIPHEEVTQEQRRIAKTANFGIMYGISAFGLAQRLKIGRDEAKKIIEDYFASFPSIRSFIDDTLSTARETGYVETLFGRRRYIPEVNAKNGTIRALAERNAVNAPIQGTSADIIKLAMIGVDKMMTEKNLKSKMVLQIHDELVFDTLSDEIDTLKEIVVSQMENVVKLSVPLTVECNYGKNWLEAH